MLRLGPVKFGVSARRKSTAPGKDKGKGGGHVSPQPGKGKGIGVGPKNRKEMLLYRPTQYGEGGGGDANTIFLSHFDGADAATSATEETGKTLTFAGNAQLDTAQFKFGTASLLLDGTGDYVSTPDYAGLAFGAGDFTVEMFARLTTKTTNQAFISQWGTGVDLAFGLWHASGQIRWRHGFNTSSLRDVNVAWSPSLSTWYHIAVDRSGTTTRIYIDGVMIKKDTLTGDTINNSTVDLRIGGIPGSASLDFNGHIDEVRLCDVARYGSDAGFTPPAAPFTI